ncbi:MAG: peptidase M48, partial [Deltaproteobacteria bacterium]|nr:peptidase M48 [Deltaproteobacteria bacterium]
MLARQLRTDKEKALFVIGAIYSAQIWLLLVITIIGIFYGVFLGIGILIAQAIFLAHVRGNGVRIGPEQLPDLHAKIARAAQ